MSEKAINKWLLAVRVVWTAACARSTRVFYDRISDIYEHVFTDHIIHIENIVALLSLAYPGRKKCLVLDLGCGTGLLSKALCKRGFSVIGLDISLKSLHVLQHSDQRVLTIQGEIEYLPFKDNTFQAMCCLGVWRHLVHTEIVIAEICRVLGDHGTFVLGYFPPKFGGLFYIRNNTLGKLLALIYSRLVNLIGYNDQIHSNFEKGALQSIRKRFQDVQKIKSGKYWYLIHASRPPR